MGGSPDEVVQRLLSEIEVHRNADHPVETHVPEHPGVHLEAMRILPGGGDSRVIGYILVLSAAEEN